MRLRCAILFLLALPIIGVAPREDTPSSQPAQNYFALSPADFAKTSAANQQIDFDHIDQRLLSAAIMHETNRYRAESKLAALGHLDELDRAAMIHVKDMVEKTYLAHEETGTRYRNPIDRMRATGLRPILAAENIATAFGIRYEGGKKVFPLSQWGREGLSYSPDGPAIPRHSYQSFAVAVVKGWWNSPHHKENLLLPDARFLGSAALPAKPAADGSDRDFHKFYCAQEFFSPMPR